MLVSVDIGVVSSAVHLPFHTHSSVYSSAIRKEDKKREPLLHPRRSVFEDEKALVTVDIGVVS